MPVANKKNLIEHLQMGDVDAAALSAALKEARTWSHDPVELAGAADQALELADKLLSGHGVEPIRGDYQVDRYYYDVVALYVNMGDTYNTTLLYETENERFLVTSWGDWVEKNERKYRIQ